MQFVWAANAVVRAKVELLMEMRLRESEKIKVFSFTTY